MASLPITPLRSTLVAGIRRFLKLLMVLKDPTSRMASDTLHLSVLDQNTVRVYTQTLLIFPFPDNNNAEAAVIALENGLRDALEKFPFLAGKLSLVDAVSGRLSLVYPTVIPDLKESGLFAAANVPLSAERFPRTYEQLKQNGMPPSEFTGARFCPNDLLNYPGVPRNGEGMVDFEKSDAPAMRVQAYFIPGGLVLSAYFHHAVVDCSGANSFWLHFAKHVTISRQISEGQKIEISAPAVIPDQSTIRRQLDARIPTPIPAQGLTAEAYIDGKYLYSKTLEENTPCTSRYFVIPASRIRAFRNQLKPHFPDGPPLTICNVLAALLWTHITRARTKRLGNCDQHPTSVGIATDLRKRMEPKLGASYMGNMALFSKGTLKVSDLTAEECVTEKTILHAIREIRRTISKVNNDWVTRHLTFFKSIEKIEDTECALGFRFGLDLYITSWMNFGADISWGIPGTDLNSGSLEGRPEFIRRSYHPADGGMIIMPRRRKLVDGVEAPYEVMVRLAECDMRTLMEEAGGLSTWAERIVH